MKLAIQFCVSFILMAVSGCSTYTCQDPVNDFSMLKSCDMVVIYNKSSARTIEISGYNPRTHKSVDYMETDAFYVYIYPAIAPGDSVFKRRDDNCFLIKKEKFNIKFSIDCKAKNQSLGKMSEDTIAK